MTPVRDQSWPLAKALAFVLAAFALSLGVMLPSAAAAASGSETPIRFCSGRMSDLVIVDGQVRQKSDGEIAITDCAFVMAGQIALPAPPPVTPPAPTRPVGRNLGPCASRDLTPPARAPPRPPSTAPPETRDLDA